MTPTLFQTLLGASFYSLPPAVRELHGVRGQARYSGRTTIERGRNPIARLCARMAGLPPAMREVETTVDFQCERDGETWSRRFGARPMQSRLRRHGRLLDETLGWMRLRFALYVHEDAIQWRMAGARVFGVVPLPVSWFADVSCRECAQDGRYVFQVEASMPGIGRLIRYEGWLERA